VSEQHLLNHAEPLIIVYDFELIMIFLVARGAAKQALVVNYFDYIYVFHMFYS